MSNSAWCDLISKGDTLKTLDKRPNPECGCQKNITFTPHQYMLEGGSIKVNYKSFSEEQKKLGIKFQNQQLVQRCRL